MNFFGHYYVDHKRDDPYFVLGIILPDVYRGFSKIFNLHLRQVEGRSAEEIQLIKGFHRHYEVDGIFHYTDAFEQASEAIEAICAGYPQFELPRLFFFSHIMLELLLDRKILQHRPDLAIRFYDQLSSIDIQLVDSYFNNTGFNTDNSQFLLNFQNFVSNRYLYRLLNNENLFAALQRLYFTRVKYAPSKEQEPLFLELLSKCSEEMDHHWENLVQQTKEKLSL